MQLMKQARKAQSGPRQKIVKLSSFNPVMKPGFEIAAFTTLPNLMGPTHGLVVTQKKEAQ